MSPIIRTLVLVITFAFAHALSYSQIHDTTSLSAFGAYGSISAMSKNGNVLYLGGSFTHIGKYTGSGVWLNPTTGNLLPSPRIDGYVLSAISDGNGGWFM